MFRFLIMGCAAAALCAASPADAKSAQYGLQNAKGKTVILFRCKARTDAEMNANFAALRAAYNQRHAKDGARIHTRGWKLVAAGASSSVDEVKAHNAEYRAYKAAVEKIAAQYGCRWKQVVQTK